MISNGFVFARGQVKEFYEKLVRDHNFVTRWGAPEWG
jgi:hypothetical protein